MVADVPVGVLLSGGIDSSIVVALLAEKGQEDLKTFCIGFDAAGGESGDEFDYSDLVAKTFGTDHHGVHIDRRDAARGAEDLAAMSEPMVSHDFVAFYLLRPARSRKSIKVVQSGQGADEILGGYDWYPPLAGIARDADRDAYAKAFFDRPPLRRAGCSARVPSSTTTSAGVRRRALRRARGPTPRWTPRCA